MADLKSAFEQFDKNKDGVLERGEFRRGLFLLKAELTAAQIAELMQARAHVCRDALDAMIVMTM